MKNTALKILIPVLLIFLLTSCIEKMFYPIEVEREKIGLLSFKIEDSPTPEYQMTLYSSSDLPSSTINPNPSNLQDEFDGSFNIILEANNSESGILFDFLKVSDEGIYTMEGDLFSFITIGKSYSNLINDNSFVKITDFGIETYTRVNETSKEEEVFVKKSSYLEGEFEIECANESGDTLKITDGKFYLGYKY